MEGINTQFFGEFKVALWIKEAFSEGSFETLLNRNVSAIREYECLDFWVIGPKEDTPETLFLYGHPPESGSVCREIESINPVDQTTLLVLCSNGRWFKLEHRSAASSIAKKVDMLINGSYTDVALIHADEIFEMIPQ